MPEQAEVTLLRRELAEMRSQLAQLAGRRVPGPMVDPAPWPYQPYVDPAPTDWPRWPYPRPEFPIPWPGDPAPQDLYRRAYPAEAPVARVAEAAYRPYSPVVDPAPHDWQRGAMAMAAMPAARVAERAYWPYSPVVDPAPWDWWRRYQPVPEWRWPRPGDPAPFDSARFRVALGLDLRQVAGRILGLAPDKLTIKDVARLHIGDVIGIEPGPVVDPAPDDVGRWVRIDPRLIRPIPWPGDPAPFDAGRFQAVENVKLLDAVARITGVAADKVKVSELAKISVRDLILQVVRIPDGGDPPPIDYVRYAEVARARAVSGDLSVREISAMDKPELQATLHRINAEITRFESLRELVEKRMEG